MKLKSLLSVAVISALSANAFAIEIHKGRIVSHKEWSTGNGKAVFKVGKPSADILNKRNASIKNVNGSSHYVTSRNGIIEGTVGSAVDLTGENYIFINNHTASTTRYAYFFHVCSVLGSNTTTCSYYYDQIELEPEGYANISISPVLKLTYDNVGRYTTYMGASLMEMTEGGFGGNQSSSNSEGLVVISDPMAKQSA